MTVVNSHSPTTATKFEIYIIYIYICPTNTELLLARVCVTKWYLQFQKVIMKFLSAIVKINFPIHTNHMVMFIFLFYPCHINQSVAQVCVSEMVIRKYWEKASVHSLCCLSQISFCWFWELRTPQINNIHVEISITSRVLHLFSMR